MAPSVREDGNAGCIMPFRLTVAPCSLSVNPATTRDPAEITEVRGLARSTIDIFSASGVKLAVIPVRANDKEERRIERREDRCTFFIPKDALLPFLLPKWDKLIGGTGWSDSSTAARVLALGWSDMERLVICTADGILLIYSVQGEFLYRISLPAVCGRKRGIIGVCKWCAEGVSTIHAVHNVLAYLVVIHRSLASKE